MWLRWRDRRYRPPSEPLIVWTPPERQAFAGLREAAVPFQGAPPREAELGPVVDAGDGPEPRPSTIRPAAPSTPVPCVRSAAPRIGALLPYLAAVVERPEPATEPQVEALERMGLRGETAALSIGQADAILCAGVYGAAVVRALGPEDAKRFEEARLEAWLAALLVQDEALRRHALAWCGQNLAKRGSRRRPPPRDEHFSGVEQAARVLLGLLDRGGSVLALTPTAPVPR